MKKIIIAGSSRNDGHTFKLVNELIKITDWDIIDLNDYSISYYDYEHKNRNDDFLPLIRRIISDYDIFIFATPVYWYSMSGIMKVFFDRFSDLITIEKDLGRQLRGKYMAVISCSNGSNLGDSFWLPFRATAEYLGMKYISNLHTYQNSKSSKKLEKFAEEINSATNFTAQSALQP